MGAGLRVDACVGNAQPLDGTSIDQVLFDDLGSVFGPHAAVPHGFWIDNDSRAMLALVEAERLVDADIRQARSLCKLLQLDEDFALSIGRAGRAGRSFGTNVMADKDVMLVKRQSGGPPESRLKADAETTDWKMGGGVEDQNRGRER
jgi:hypothetical protein